MQIDVAAALDGRGQRRFVIVAQQMLVFAATVAQSSVQQPLRKDHAGTGTFAVGSMTTLTNAIEAVTWGNHPGVAHGPLQIAPKVLENGWEVGRDGGEIIEGLVDTGCKTGSGYIVSENAAVDYTGEESSLRDQLIQEMLNILLTILSKGFIVAGTSAEGNDYGFRRTRRGPQSSWRNTAKESGSDGGASSGPQEIAATSGNSVRHVSLADSIPEGVEQCYTPGCV